MQAVCDECFNTINVPESAVGKRYRCKVCGTTCTVKDSEDAFTADSDYRSRSPKRPSSRSRKKKKSRKRNSGTSNVRGLGFGCLYYVIGLVGFGILTALIIPIIFNGRDWNFEALGELAGLIGVFIIAPIAAIAGFIRHRISG